MPKIVETKGGVANGGNPIASTGEERDVWLMGVKRVHIPRCPCKKIIKPYIY